MERRRFLQLVTSSAVSAYAFDLDKLLWVPGQKTIFIPPERKLIWAGEVAALEFQHTIDIVKRLFESDKLLYEVLHDKPVYKHQTGDYQTVQIYHGVKLGERDGRNRK
jgi:hypothetical protein